MSAPTKKEDGLCRGLRARREVPQPCKQSVQLVYGPNTNDIGVMFPITTLDLCRGGGTEAMLSNLLFFDERLICSFSFLLQCAAALSGRAAYPLHHPQLQCSAASDVRALPSLRRSTINTKPRAFARGFVRFSSAALEPPPDAILVHPAILKK